MAGGLWLVLWRSSRATSVVWGMGALRNPCRLRPGLVLPQRPCPELVAGASTTPCQLPLRVFQMLGCTDLNEELNRALEIFPTYLQSQCLGMPSLVLRGILRLTETPDTVSRGQPGQLGQQPRVEQWAVGNTVAWAFLGIRSCASCCQLSCLPSPLPHGCAVQGERQQCRGNGLPLPAHPSRDAGSRATSLSMGSAEPGRGVLSPGVKCSSHGRGCWQLGQLSRQRRSPTSLPSGSGEEGSQGAGKGPVLSILPLCALLFPWPCQ